ncbi:hypothetical protein JD276_15685, partial [Leucobacter sp. CSA1]
MSEYTPTTDKVLSYIRGNAVMAGASADEAQAAASGWLASVEREAAARALEEAAAALKRPSEGAAYEVWAYGGGDWLRSRAA